MEPNFFNNAELQLLRKDGSTVRAIDALKDAEYILVYCSAHWCPPCRGFTPLLKTFYEQHHAKKKFEVVFLSLDRSDEEMMDYFTSAHGDYYCLPFEDAKSIAPVWGQTYQFQTIPTLLVFESGAPRKLIARCGRDMVPKDPQAESFPWRGADETLPSPSNLGSYLRQAMLLGCVLWLVYSIFFRKEEDNQQ